MQQKPTGKPNNRLGNLLFWLVFLGVLAVIGGIATLQYRNNPAAIQGMKILQADPAVTSLLGGPIDEDFLVFGKTQQNLDHITSGIIWTNITGPNAKGRVVFTVTMPADGAWTLEKMTIAVNGRVALEWDATRAADGFQPPADTAQ
jgi:hypothetical protein